MEILEPVKTTTIVKLKRRLPHHLIKETLRNDGLATNSVPCNVWPVDARNTTDEDSFCSETSRHACNIFANELVRRRNPFYLVKQNKGS